MFLFFNFSPKMREYIARGKLAGLRRDSDGAGRNASIHPSSGGTAYCWRRRQTLKKRRNIIFWLLCSYFPSSFFSMSECRH